MFSKLLTHRIDGHADSFGNGLLSIRLYLWGNFVSCSFPRFHRRIAEQLFAFIKAPAEHSRFRPSNVSLSLLGRFPSRLNRLRGSPKSNVFLVDAKVMQYARNTAQALISHMDSRINDEAKERSILSRVYVADDAKWERIPWVGQVQRDDDTLKADDIVAIVTLKALDYAEEVAMFIAEHILSHLPAKAQSVRIYDFIEYRNLINE